MTSMLIIWCNTSHFFLMVCSQQKVYQFKKPTSELSGPEPTKGASTGSSERSSFGERYQGLPQSQPWTQTSPVQMVNADQRALTSSPYTAAIEGRLVWPRDQDNIPQPIRALPVDSRGDPLYAHSVSRKEIDYLTDNLIRELRPARSVTRLTSGQPFSPYGPQQAQPKLTHQDDVTNLQPRLGIRQADRPRDYYNEDHKGHNYPFIDHWDHSQSHAAVRFMPQDYSQDETYTDVSHRPVRYFPSTVSQGYHQPYHGHLATSLISHDKRLTTWVMLSHHACFERHSDYYERPMTISSDEQRQPADYAQPVTDRPYHPVHPPSPNTYVEPSYRGPIPTIPNFCSEDPRVCTTQNCTGEFATC